MAGTATKGDRAPTAEEARLARAAAGGDGDAFATLYQRYEGRAYNLAYRVTGSESDAAEATQDAFLSVMRRLPKLEDRELAFGSYLFTATRNACYDLIEARRRTRPSEAIAETATPLGSGGGGGGGSAPDPGDPEEDPDRKLLLESQQEEVRAANMRLPERQREALALRELEELSYDEIAAIMAMNRNSVAQLISRARINLRDELRGTALAAVAASAPQCERALPLIAMRDDGQLEPGGEDDAWLDEHLAGCERCRLGVEAMQEAGASYRAWAPIAAAPWLLQETMAKAAELAGADWSEATAATLAARESASPSPLRRRRTIVAAGIAALLLGGGVATVLAGGDSAPAPERPAAETVPPSVLGASSPANQAQQPAKAKKAKAAQTNAAQPQQAPATTSALPPASAPETGASTAGKPASPTGPGTTGVQTTRKPATKQPRTQPDPAPEATPPPPPPPPPEEPEDEPEPETEEPREPDPREPPAGIPPRLRTSPTPEIR